MYNFIKAALRQLVLNTGSITAGYNEFVSSLRLFIKIIVIIRRKFTAVRNRQDATAETIAT